MSDTTRIEIVSELAHALSLLDKCHSAIDRIYNKDPGSFYAAAMQCPERRNPALACGRAEHQVVALKALGIFTGGTTQEKSVILRAAIRSAYDALQKVEPGTHVNIEDYVKLELSQNDNDDIYYAKVVAVMGVCAIRGITSEQTNTVNMVIDYIGSRRTEAAARQSKNKKKIQDAINIMRNHLFTTESSGISGLYDNISDQMRENIERMLFILCTEGIDSGVYTNGVNIDEYDADLLVQDDDPEHTTRNAIMLMLARAIRRDRNFCLQLYRSTGSDEAKAAKLQVIQAEARAKAADDRISELESTITSLARDLDKANAELASHASDAEELSSLRSALYLSNRENMQDYTKPEHTRTIPDNVIAIGGHPTWAKAIQDASSVRVWPTGTTCPTSVIASASEVWIQSAYMSHTDFYAAIGIARQRNIPVRYFSSTGASRCLDDLRRAD